MTALKRISLFLLAFALVLAASGCGPSVEETYFTNLTPAVEEYNAALAGVGTQFEGISNDALNDQAWMDATFAALDRLDAAGQALAATPNDQIPEKWVELDNTLVQISDQTTTFVTNMKAALESQDKDAMLAALDEFSVIGTLFEQAKGLLDAG